MDTQGTCVIRSCEVSVFGIPLVGINAENGSKLLLTLVFIAIVILLRWLLRAIARLFVRGDTELWRARFWTHQAISVFCAVVMAIGIVSIWFNDPGRLATVAGLVTAGVAIALQK